MSKDNNIKEEERRKILKSTLAGGAIVTANIMPDDWTEPVLDSIILPAHAQTSGDAADSDAGSGTDTGPEPNVMTNTSTNVVSTFVSSGIQNIG
jgi:hypothetical protein